MAQRAVVVGGGFVGVSCALHLQRVGFRVTLMEAGPSVGGRHAASNGNAGTFARYANVPVQRPGLWRDAPGMILNPRGALRLALNPHLLKMVPWWVESIAITHLPYKPIPFKPITYNLSSENRFQSLPFKCNLQLYNVGDWGPPGLPSLGGAPHRARARHLASPRRGGV
jgi:hypothetical protein